MTETAGEQPVQPMAKPDKDSQGSQRRRFANRWNGLSVAGKAVVIGGAAIALVGGFIVLAARASSVGPEHDDSESNGESDASRPVVPELTRRVTNHMGGYVLCSHEPCTKKIRPSITGHDCCGRCRTSSIRKCAEVAQRDYDGPGSFPHEYWESPLFPDACITCEEPPEGHWVLDGAATHLR
ncbi:hypothetical protein ACLQ2H_09760 [Streptomyces globisporus]|uniref:hypothetical protein n=1 Tax=Streptomyces globisporus TaxID=1908 RepID=UPI003CE7293D